MSQFLDRIKERAMMDKKTIVLAEGEEIRSIEAAAKVLKEGIANIILLGDEKVIAEKAAGLDISAAQIINPVNSDKYQAFAEQFCEMRKAKGMTMDKALETLKNTLYFGCMLVKNGEADGMVAGAVNSTSNVLRSALQTVKTAPGAKLVSAFFVICVPDCEYGHNGTFVFGDSGLVMNPNAEELSEIAISSAKSFKDLVEAEPNVALLSFSTYGSAKDPLVDKVVEATKLAKEKRPDLSLDGELQLDAAIVESVGKSKAPESTVAGKANVLVFPDLNAGNIGYKLAQRLGKAEAYGPITQGIGKPINDLSRGCSADDIVGVVAITCVQAQNQ
ncbi:MAG: phosphate acetyltransferase [Ruminococcaceae bacterium]|nr:phosphate acetyltransferase [Oscillospiraceae bacterium]